MRNSLQRALFNPPKLKDMRKIIPFNDVREVKDKEGALLARISFENEDYLEQVKGVNVYYDCDSFLSNYQADLEQSGLSERRFLQHLIRAYEQAVSEIKYCVNYVYGQEVTYTPNTHKKSNFTQEQLERIDDSLWGNGEMDVPILVAPNRKRIKIRLQTAFEDNLNEIKEKSANISKSASEDDAQSLPPQPIVESPFSVLEWATIFYYADETKLLTESRLIKTRLEQFMSKHQVNTTFDNFKVKYYEAKRRINKKNDYPINKLELIIPFLKENYKQTVTKVENDIFILEENKPDY